MNEEVREAMASCPGGVTAVLGLSAIINVLTLAGSLYMMLVYDLVIPGRSGASLAGLLVIVTIAYSAQAYAERLRGRIQRQAADVVSMRLQERAVGISRRHALEDVARNQDPTNDLGLVRAYFAGPGPAALMDAPWIVVFIAVLWLLHPWLGIATLGGAAVLVALTWITQRRLARPGAVLEVASTRKMLDAEERRRTARTAHALGMNARLDARGATIAREADEAREAVAEIGAAMTGTSRTARTLLQSVVLTVGALLVIQDKATGGVIFASSILSSRALAPVDQIIANWRGLDMARTSWTRLKTTFASCPPPAKPLPLPEPARDVRTTGMSVRLGDRVILQDVTFTLNAGQALAVLGSSGAGKTTLLAALAGALPSSAGEIAVDGARLDQWDANQLGRRRGYLPQDVQLLRGTVAENISRLDPDAPPAAIVEAARAVGAHDMILSLPAGYDTPLGENGAGLSAGQRQRIGLARALYGNPFIVILDEPNSNLDAEGETALSRAIRDIRLRNGIVVVASHRTSVLDAVDTVLILHEGNVRSFGPRDQIVRQTGAGKVRAA